MRIERVSSADGATVTVHSIGNGPGVVIVHGAGVTVRDYGRLAQRLAQRFTVHLYNRRGREDSAALTGDETEQTDLDDLAVVLRHTRAANIFGHSGGGFVALRAGLSLPVDRIAVYDPAVALNGVEFPRDFMASFDAAVAAGDPALAIAIMGRDINPQTAAARLPLSAQRLIVRGFLHTPPGKQMGDLLPTIGPELHRILDRDGPASGYAGITADVLLAYGTRSSRFFAGTCQSLAQVIPTARVVAIPRASHNSANIAPPRFVTPFADFFR